MYKLFFLIFFVLTLSASDNLEEKLSIPQNLIEKIRTTYYNGIDNEDYIDSLQSIITRNFSDDKSKYPTIVLAYSAGVEALKSKHAFWPFTKMSYLNSSMELFDKALLQDPNNLEIRFMRYSILHYVPGILGFGSELDEDQKIILNLLAKKKSFEISDELRTGIISFMIESGRLDQNQIDSLKSIQISLLK